MNIPSPFVAGLVDWNRDQEMALLLQETVAQAVVQYGPNASLHAATPTGLANDATAYTATVVSNDGTSNVSVVGSAAQTFGTLITEINADLAAADCTAALVGNTIVITKDTDVGAGTFVNVTDITLFASVQKSGSGGFGLEAITSTKGNDRFLRWDRLGDVQQEFVSDVIDAFVAAAGTGNQPWLGAQASVALPTTVPTAFTETGLVRTTVYQLAVTVNGVGPTQIFINLNIPQTTGTTFDHLVGAINTALFDAGVAATCEFRAGVDATIQPPRLLFTAHETNVAVTGVLAVGATSAMVVAAGGANDLIAALNGVFGAVVDTAQAGYAFVGFNRVNAATVAPATVPAVPAGNYDATVTVYDETTTDALETVDVTVAVLATDSMTDIAATFETALQAATTDQTETVDAIGNGFLISETDTGFGRRVLVTIPTAGANPDLFQAIAAALDVVDPRGETSVSLTEVDGFATPGVDGVVAGISFPETVDGIAYANWLEVLSASQVGGRLAGQFVHGPSGFGPLFTSGSAMVFEREDKPAAKGDAVETAVYWNGTDWLYFGDDAIVDDDANNPPEA
jgi:hypothetical protein